MATYEFAGFIEADLLQGSKGSIGTGDSFVMLANATTHFVVTEDDHMLSGDHNNNQNGL